MGDKRTVSKRTVSKKNDKKNDKKDKKDNKNKSYLITIVFFKSIFMQTLNIFCQMFIT
jgi:hypothetical protein